MVQVENEIGMIPTARDHDPEAERAFAAAVPAGLMGTCAEPCDFAVLGSTHARQEPQGGFAKEEP